MNKVTNKVAAFLQLTRVSQWSKNLFIFTPLFFSGGLLDSQKLISSFLAFFSFCLVASAVYVINDLKDVDADRAHPEKKNRPIASGKIGRSEAFVVLLFCFATGFAFALRSSIDLLWIVLLYFGMNILYTYKLKSIAIVDIIIISLGFIFRVSAGGAATNTEISHWLYIMTFLLALFIGLAKRRDDVLIQLKTGQQMRKSIGGYNLEFISTSIAILCAVLIVSYLNYITSSEITARFPHKNAYVSTVFVVVGILRYLQITLVEEKSGAPSKILLKDTFLQITILLWVIYFAVLIYIK